MAQKKSSVITIEEAKRWLRRALIRRRQAISTSNRKKWSNKAVARLLRSPIYKRSKTLALFLGFASEISTESLVKQAWKDGKQVLLPMTTDGFHKPFFALFKKGDKLARTKFGPLELVEKKKPFNFSSIDLVVIPGLGFDSKGRRLGYGGGVYDRMLVQTPRAKHIGLFFDTQKLDALPVEKHDHKIGVIVTEKALLP